jgi:hypothetical protein
VCAIEPNTLRGQTGRLPSCPTHWSPTGTPSRLRRTAAPMRPRRYS